MGCNSRTWCKGGRRSLHGPSTHTALQQQPLCCWLTLPGKGNTPRETLLACAIDLAKCCCEPSLTAWSVSRMKLRFIEVPILKIQGYLSEFSGSPFAMRQDCAGAQSLPFLFLQQQTLFFMKTRKLWNKNPCQRLKKPKTLIKINN